MIATEKEAREGWWCPMARVGLTAGMAVNRHPDPTVEEDCRCRASGCAMWRWSDPEARYTSTLSLTPRQIEELRERGWKDHTPPLVGGLKLETPRDERRGHCGLAFLGESR